MTTVRVTQKEMEIEAARFARGLLPASAARVIALSGDLGAGKTSFTQALARAFGVEETVTSPTYVIEKIYKLTDKSFSKLIHIDAYRLESAIELEKLGWHDMVSNSSNLIVIEWPERVIGIIPADAETITFTVVDEHTRDITFAS